MDYLEQRLHDAMAQAEQSGKEPFDFPTFTELYFHDTGDCERLKPDAPASIQNYYKRMYYVDYPEVTTVAEYAKMLNQMDQDS